MANSVDPDQTAISGGDGYGSTLFVEEASNISADDKNIHFCDMGFKGNLNVSSLNIQSGFS